MLRQVASTWRFKPHQPGELADLTGTRLFSESFSLWIARAVRTRWLLNSLISIRDLAGLASELNDFSIIRFRQFGIAEQ